VPTAARTNAATATVALVRVPEDESPRERDAMGRRLRARRGNDPSGPIRPRRGGRPARRHRTRASRHGRATPSGTPRRIGAAIDPLGHLGRVGHLRHQSPDRAARPNRRDRRGGDPAPVRVRGPSNRRSPAGGRRRPRRASLRSFEHRLGRSARRSRSFVRRPSSGPSREDAAALDRPPPRRRANPSRSPAEPRRSIRGRRIDRETGTCSPSRDAVAPGRAADRSPSPAAAARLGGTKRSFPPPHLADDDLPLASPLVSPFDAPAGFLP